jgi:hypothetical protein
MAHRNYRLEKGEIPDMASAGQARAGGTDEEILQFVGAELASPLPLISTKFGLSHDQMRSRLQSLVERRLLRVHGTVDSPDAVYSITQDGARKLETVKKGLTAYLSV